MRETLSSTPPRPAPLVFAIVLPLTAALILLPDEFSHYRRWFELGSNETALRLAVLSAILAKTLVAILTCIGLLALCARRLRPRAIRVGSLIASLSVLGGLAADLALQRNVGNHLTDYLPYLLDPATFRWAGEGFDVVPALRSVAGKLAMAFLPAGFIAWAIERWVVRSPDRRDRAATIGLLGIAMVPIVAAPLLGHFSGAPVILDQLRQRLPWAWNIHSGDGAPELESSQAEAQALYVHALPEFEKSADPVVHLLEQEPVSKPDILLVVVESLRHDALDRETMPNVWAMSGMGSESESASPGGFRLETHYATSNASHYGLFALLYGRSPLLYFETLDSREPPTLPNQLREWGYATHYVTCTNIHWREMDRFMGPPHFIVENMSGGSLEDCDREVVARAATLLAPGDRAPRLVMVFLMSTHFGYHYPAGAEPFQPALAPPNALEIDAQRDASSLMNRYRNSAHYVDSLIGSLLDRIPLEQTFVVVTGDHGESLFDDGTIAHSSLLSDIQTRVPFAMSGPGVLPRTIRRGPTDHSDVMPTLFARLGIEAKDLGVYSGRDLLGGGLSEFVPLVHAKSRRTASDRLALVSPNARYSMRLDAGRGEMRFMGKMGTDGHPSRERISQTEGVKAVRWFARYLEAVASN